ncbi:MAG: fumarylacetoacetase [Pseudomonadota bacterium]
MSGLLPSWVDGANDPEGAFPLNNLPYGVFSSAGSAPRCGVAVGHHILDVALLEAQGLINLGQPVFTAPSWNALMALGPAQWRALRTRLTDLLCEGGETALWDDQALRAQALVPQEGASLHLPLTVTEFTDFYASRQHATNVGTMFRGAENALPPNWLHMPIGYNGRASSVVVSGTPIRRPWGQIMPPEAMRPRWAPSERFDMELELGAIIGVPSAGPLSVATAQDTLFGYVLLNDWSARDIQAWEYQPLGPFQAKATATTISPWIVTSAALAPFQCAAPAREVSLLPHLADRGPMHLDLNLTASLTPQGGSPSVITRTNARELYYSFAQQVAHHASSGCPMRVGDLIGSGTISGEAPGSRGSLLELSWGSKDPFALEGGEKRSFLLDGDTITLNGHAQGDGYRLGFGACAGQVSAAKLDPFSAE